MKKFVSLILCSGILVLAGLSTGCSLCCAPYDYCGPVYANGGCSNLARMRCGTAFNGGCATCGAHGQIQEFVDQNGRPVPQNAPQMQPSPAPDVAPSVMPAPAPSTTQPLPAPSAKLPSQTQYRTASVAQTQTSPMAPALPASSAPQDGAVAVDASGYARVAVYDENNQLLGYEMVDSTGKSVNQVQVPANVR
ncbi:MAG: hypothetical protein Q4A17_10475 [Thermoguttaceae bacterium]|nr:hypothetical protein [Thermoguttaceae bacterium]